ncbi:FKBP-type peptidyl-prolyl cis-trans isomerase [Balneolaceae bacterium YR4-1]|uniref:Peptidyl-prolyl cis-trans isomerase n=1 Tax=Halalkalibaculum roseum TaxID=2709311 RepID=A0A6M1STU4_9BACT|nr:FKBP-type peptidyl-prolyl cis-trans isomerase [Halalkalibaculum roseum]NGP76350.1 FKBP-type peptidyl-prolyl cis-trans isomerase [Halalkalibaculum roseum]
MINKISTTAAVLSVALALILTAGCNNGQESGSDAPEANLSTNIDSVSYGIGYMNGQSMRQQGMDDIEAEDFVAGLRQAMNEEDPQISQNEINQLLQQYQMKAQQKAQQMKQEEAQSNREEGESFLAENRNKEGVQVTDSGLQYKVLEEGSGESPAATDSVTVHYEGTLIDGTVFDSSYERGEPATFPLNRVIEGWTEGLQLMKEGATYRFYIPGDLAYGMNPRPGGPIGPNETLIFKVELLEVN